MQTLLPSRKDAVSLLERKMAILSGYAQGLAFRYGRSGIYFLLKALGAKGQKVIIPSYTCVVVPHAIIKSGNIPVFLDNSQNTFQPDPEEYLKAIDDETVMVVFTNLFGIAENVSEVYKKIKFKYPNVFILQDCAHSFFCTDANGDSIMRYGDGAVFGMNISKLVNSVKGGMLTIKDTDIANKIRELAPLKKQSVVSNLISRAYTFITCFAFSNVLYRITYTLQHKTNLLSRFTTYYNEDSIDLPNDYDYQMSNFEAEIGLLSITGKYDSRVSNRREIAQIYLKKLKDISNQLVIKLPNDNIGNTWSHFPVVVRTDLKPKIIEALSQRYEIGEIVDYSITDLTAYKSKGFKCINSSRDAQSIINLPLTYSEGLFAPRDYKKEASIFIDKLIAIINH